MLRNPYKVRLYDDELQLLGIIDELQSVQVQNRPNSAGSGMFGLLFDNNLLDVLELATNISIYRYGSRKFSGRVTSRDIAPDSIGFTTIGQEDRLRKLVTPRNWEGWNGQDLADVARDATRWFRFKRYSTYEDWKAVPAHHRVNVDIETDPGFIHIAYEPHPDDPDNERPVAHGYIIFRIDLGASASADGRFVRWSEQVGATEEITIQTRSANSSSSLDSISWDSRPEHRATHVGDVQENEVYGVPASGDGRWLDVKVNFYANERDKPIYGPDQDVIGYGYTPILQGVEVVWREPSEIRVGNIPATTGTEVYDFEFDRTSHLQALVELCNEYGWEFKVRHEEATGELFLDLGAQTASGWSPTIGEDRSRTGDMPVVLRDGTNAVFQSFQDSIDEVVNVLHCWGAGEGTEQLYTELRNEESIAFYGEELHGELDVPHAETLAELILEGQEELDNRSMPKTVFELEVTDYAFEDYGLHDFVSVVHPKTRQIIDEARILEEKWSWTTQGETILFGVNDHIFNPLEVLRGSGARHKTARYTPSTPTQVSATGLDKAVYLRWQSQGSGLYAIRHRQLPNGNWSIVAETVSREYTHGGLEPNSQHAYQVALVKNGRISAWSPVVSAVVLEEGASSFLDQLPENPVFDDCEFTHRVFLRWKVSERATNYEVRTNTNWGDRAGLIFRGNALEYVHVPTSRNYTFYLRAINVMGDYSEGYDTVTLSIPVPLTPSPPQVVAFFEALWIQPLPVTQPSIIGHRIRAQNLATHETVYLETDLHNHAIFYAETGEEIQLEIASVDAVGAGPYSTPIVVSVNSLKSRDIPAEAIDPSHLSETLREDVRLSKEWSELALEWLEDLDEDLESVLARIAHSIFLSNEHQSFVTEADGKVVSVTTVRTDIEVYYGTGRIAATIGTPVVKSSTGTTLSVGTFTKQNPTVYGAGFVEWSIPANTNVGADSGWIEIPITVEGIEYTKKLSWSKAKRGATGPSGAPAPQVKVRYSTNSTGPWYDDYADGRKWMQTSVDGGSTWSTAVKIVGEDGSAGKDGKYTDYQFAKNQSKTSAPPSSQFTDAPPALGDGEFLWMRSRTVSPPDPPPAWNTPVRISGDKGDKGDPAPTLKVQYSTTSSGATWYDDYATGRKWMRTSADNGVTWSTPAKIVGEDGSDGVDGKYTDYQFAKNTSLTTAPTSGWTDAPPSLGTTEYLWMRSRVVTPSGAGSWSTAVRISGPQGSKGDKGDKGSPGEDAKLVNIVASHQFFTGEDQGDPPTRVYTPTSIVLTPQFQNCSFSKWQYSTNGTSWTDVTSGQNGLTINSTTKALTVARTSNLFTDVQNKITFKVLTTTGEFDITTIGRIYDSEKLVVRMDTEINKLDHAIQLRAVKTEVYTKDQTDAKLDEKVSTTTYTTKIAEIEVEATNIRNTVGELSEDLDGNIAEVLLLKDEYTVKMQEYSGGKKIAAGFGMAKDKSGNWEFGILANNFKVYGVQGTTIEDEQAVFSLDTEKKKLYLRADLIADGSILANHIEADAIKTLLLNAGVAFIDHANILRLKAESIVVGQGYTSGIVATKPPGHLWHFDRHLSSTDGVAPAEATGASIVPEQGIAGGALEVASGGTVRYDLPMAMDTWTWAGFFSIGE